MLYLSARELQFNSARKAQEKIYEINSGSVFVPLFDCVDKRKCLKV